MSWRPTPEPTEAPVPEPVEPEDNNRGTLGGSHPPSDGRRQEEPADVHALDAILTPRDRDLGGFVVRRLLPASRHPTVGPFVFFDHFGPTDLAPGNGLDVRPHPHIN